jgi:hypothetical protein
VVVIKWCSDLNFSPDFDDSARHNVELRWIAVESLSAKVGEAELCFVGRVPLSY